MKKKIKPSIFSIYTEDKNYEKNIKPILDLTFDGSSIWRGEGRWKGTAEKCLRIDIITTNKTLIDAVGLKIKQANNQEAVIITETKCEVRFI